jgi:hypothetical protein
MDNTNIPDRIIIDGATCFNPNNLSEVKPGMYCKTETDSIFKIKSISTQFPMESIDNVKFAIAYADDDRTCWGLDKIIECVWDKKDFKKKIPENVVIKLLSDHTSVDKPNILTLTMDTQGDIHISSYKEDDNENGISIVTVGSRYSKEVRMAFTNLVTVIEKQLKSPMIIHPDIKEINK